MDESTIIKKLQEHDVKFDAIDEKFDAIDKRFDEHDDRFDVITRKLIDHDEQFVLVRQEIAGLRQEMLRGQDEMLTILHRLDQERISTYKWIKRVEEQGKKNSADIAKNTKDITEIKKFLKMN
ncbi:MAG: hypothetical protein IBX64_04630 [Actinobacteria bacterium]|nr:hypothetical protein [Actinomycetota bacterium]